MYSKGKKKRIKKETVLFKKAFFFLLYFRPINNPYLGETDTHNE